MESSESVARPDQQLVISNRFSLTGRIAVVTGAARGIGRAAAAALGEQGATLLLVDVLAEDVCRIKDDLAERGIRAKALPGDVVDKGMHDEIMRVTAEVGPVSILVNAAGVMRRTNATELTIEDLDFLWQVNVVGTVAITQRLLPQMVEHGYGKIINIGSLGSVRGLERRTAYAATKGAIAQYTVSLASEVGKHGVRVNAIAPGYVDTDMTAPWIYGNPERTANLLARIPLGRFADPADLAGVFIFLAAPASDYVTGQILLVDGGWTTT